MDCSSDATYGVFRVIIRFATVPCRCCGVSMLFERTHDAVSEFMPHNPRKRTNETPDWEHFNHIWEFQQCCRQVHFVERVRNLESGFLSEGIIFRNDSVPTIVSLSGEFSPQGHRLTHVWRSAYIPVKWETDSNEPLRLLRSLEFNQVRCKIVRRHRHH